MNKWPLGKIVEVSWDDSNGYGRWSSLSDLSQHGAASCKSVGYLLKQDKKEIVLVGTQAQVNEGDGMQTLAIPMGCVTKIRKVKI